MAIPAKMGRELMKNPGVDAIFKGHRGFYKHSELRIFTATSSKPLVESLEKMLVRHNKRMYLEEIVEFRKMRSAFSHKKCI